MIAFVILQLYNGQYKRLGNEALKSPFLDPSSGKATMDMDMDDNSTHNLLNQHSSGASGGGANASGSGSGKAGGDGALVRVTSMDSGGSAGNTSSGGIIIGELSVANSSINMWNVSILFCY